MEVLVNVSSIVVTCAPVRSCPRAKLPVMLPLSVAAAIWSSVFAPPALVINGVPPICVLSEITLLVQPASIQIAPYWARPVPAPVPIVSNTLPVTMQR